MKFRYRLVTLFASLTLIVVCCAGVRHILSPAVHWLPYDPESVQESVNAGENVLIYFRSTAKDARHYPCNPENTLRYSAVIDTLNSCDVVCYVGDASIPNSPAAKEVWRLIGARPDFQLAFYRRKTHVPVLLDCSCGAYWN